MPVDRLKNYIAGEWRESKTSDYLDVVNPTTDKAIARVPMSTAADVTAAVAAARGAFQEWRETPPTTRIQYLFRLKELMEQRFEDIARTITTENGKTIDEARGETRRTIENVEVATGITSLMMGTNLEDVARGIDEEIVRQPMGAFAVIAPYNFPSMVPWWFAPYAMATGNTYIVKPSEQVPLTQSIIFELVHELDLPPGVMNLVHGGRAVVDALINSPGIVGISSVTSTPVAKAIYTAATATGKRAQCQAGAKNFIVIMPDADIEKAIPALLTSCYGCAGQRCLAGAVLIAVGDAHAALRDRFVEAARKIKVGDPLDESAHMGPVISKQHRDRVLRHVEQGVKEGAKLLLDGRAVSVPGCEAGYFIGPTIFDDVTPEMAIAREEIFGPVIGILHVGSLEEAIGIIDANPYGNASSIFTASGGAAREFKYRVKCGNIGINVGVAAPMAFFPFGGRKDSFFGDLHGQGQDVVDFLTEKKVVITRW
jgi:malonate-semialdehyde dehydrogenase (acetylating)/methylmalonate-semialdehyde dehydrogenase